MTEEKATKRIVFTKDLVRRLVAKKIRCTYRKAPKLGRFLVLDSRFKSSKDASCEIHCYRSDEVDPRKLTDKDAKVAGITSAEKLRELFAAWYGSLPSIMYRNWFTVVKVGREGE